jgi:hypothetical protein
VARARAEVETQDAPVRRTGVLQSLNPRLVAIVAVGVVALALVGFIAATRIDPSTFSNPFADDLGDTSALPNSRALAAGTPIAQLALPKPTPAAAAAQRAGAPADQATPANPPAAVPTPSPQAAANGLVTLLDENFRDNSRSWPNNQQGTAWLSGGTYRLAPRKASEFVALNVPIPEKPSDTIVSASFRKVGGPAGGGYGVIVRAQDPLDGVGQNGRYYVLEIGDKGEIGMWRRDGDHWVDLLPWQRSDAVRTGAAVNELTVRALGNNLTMLVNGSQVATRTDDTLAAGGVGLFVGGDGNQVAVDHVGVQTPATSARLSVRASS